MQYLHFGLLVILSPSSSQNYELLSCLTGHCGYLTCTYLDLECPGPLFLHSQLPRGLWQHVAIHQHKVHDSSSRRFSRAHHSDLFSSFKSFEHQNGTQTYVTCDFNGIYVCVAQVLVLISGSGVNFPECNTLWSGFIFRMTA